MQKFSTLKNCPKIIKILKLSLLTSFVLNLSIYNIFDYLLILILSFYQLSESFKEILKFLTISNRFLSILTATLYQLH